MYSEGGETVTNITIITDRSIKKDITNYFLPIIAFHSC